MADTQPPNIREGATDLEDETPALPVNAEDRKAAAALSALKDAGNEDDAQKTDVDQEALGKAMGQLGVRDEEKKNKDKEGGKGKEGEMKKKVKVDTGDVALLVEELELSKAKATELLKAYEGDAVKAMRAFVSASA
ncbi:MAG: hypothetical protein MMC33_009923 [Icmadophila ericetorum]|nr:hypothetical protein [Icmadophila ericetorum]